MKFYYDLHIHTCLSPCADDEMTPMNIAGMAKLVGLDVIAVTDHNSTANALSVIEASRKMNGPLVLAGMELETAENVHVVLLFADIEGAAAAGREVEKRLLQIDNRPQIYGRQLLAAPDDGVIGEKRQLLLTATDIGIYEAAALAKAYGGAAMPAHIDRPGGGVLEILGDVADDMGFGSVEISPHGSEALRQDYLGRGYTIFTNSDSHRLETIAERENYLELDCLSAKKVIDAIINFKE